MTTKLYLKDESSSRKTIVTALLDGERRAVRLRDTIFHPQGGGQRGDRGWIGSTQVIDTRHASDGEVDHIVENLEYLHVGMMVDVAIDPIFRRRGTLLHSGGHLIAEAGKLARPELIAIAGHHWDGESRVEFDGLDSLDDELEGDFNSSLENLVCQDLPIATVGDPYTSRAIQIGSFAPVGCGGTHVRSTGELEALKITKLKMKGGRLRVSYEL